jgi:import inner membrane translocase subunit TIM21
MMHFYVDGPSNNGVAQLHMIKLKDATDYEYKYLYLDVKGHDRIYLENKDISTSGSNRKPLSFFGVKWG